MDKINQILSDLDSGADRGVVWSARSGDRVLLHYEDGTQVIVEARLAFDSERSTD